MATDNNGVWLPSAPSTKPTAAPSIADTYRQQEQQQVVQDSVRQEEADTRVGQWEQNVGGVMDRVVNTPVLGWMVNPMLQVASVLDENIFSPLAEEAAALSPQLIGEVSAANPENDLITNWRLAREYANEVNIGQAWAKPLASAFVPLDKAVGLGQSSAFGRAFENAQFNSDDVSLLDTGEREDAFKNDPLGIAVSGGITLGAMMIGSKGIGVGTRAARTAAFGSRAIKSEADLAAFGNRVDDAAAKIDAGDPSWANATQKFMADAVAEKDITKLLDNPLVAASNNPMRSATIMSRIDKATDLADYLKAERGDIAALDRLFKSQAGAADALSNYGVKMDPLTDWQQIHALPDANQAGRLAAVLSDIRKRDSDLANALDDFGAEKGTGVALSTYQPSRFSPIERMNTTRARWKAQNQFGDAKIFGEADSGWRTKVYQSSIYDRAVRVITWAGTGRPQGHINISNPRRYEAQYDLLSDMNRLDFLKGRKGSEFKRRMVDDFARAATDSDRAAFIARYERLLMMEMADAYGVRMLRGVDGRNNVEVIQQIDDWYKATVSRRQGAREFLANHKMIPDEDGNINVVQMGIRANEPSTIPLLDFRRMELEVIRQMRRSGKDGDVIGNSPISAGKAARANLSRGTMGIGTILDIANMTFSNLNLLRLAYIPKNSMVDPYVRASMDLETVYGLNELMPGVRNMLYNRTLGFQSAAARVGWVVDSKRGKGSSMRASKKDFDRVAGDYALVSKKRTEAASARKRAVEESRSLQDALDRARSRMQNAKSGTARESARLRVERLQARLTDVNNRKLAAADDLRLAETTLGNLRPTLAYLRSDLSSKQKRLADIRSSRRRLGDEAEIDFTVDGETFRIPGLANPNVKGANAYLSAISAMEDAYAASRRSELSNKISASRSQWKPISRNNWKSYTNAVAHIANKQLRSELDEIGGLVLRGGTVDDMMSWLYSKPGRGYLRRMAARIPDKSREGVREWAEKTRADILRMFPDEDMRRIVLERDISVDEVSTFLRERPDIPENIMGPDIASSLAQAVAREADTGLGKAQAYTASILGNVTDAGWRVLSGVENRLVRNGLFMRYAKEEMALQVQAARRAGIDINDYTVHQGIRQAAYRLAVERLEQTLYSARRLTNMGYVMRYLMAFPSAFWNSQVVAARLMVKNPANAYWYQSVVDMMDGFTPYMDEEGNVYKDIADVPKGTAVSLQFPLYDTMGNIPLAGGAMQDVYKNQMGLYTDPRGGGTKINPKQMEFMLGDPSASWMTSIGLSTIIKEGIDVGPLKVYGEQIDQALRNTVGDDVYESSILFQGRVIQGDNFVETIYNGMAPSYLKNLSSGTVAILFNSDTGLFGDRRFASDVAANTRLGIEQATKNGTDKPTPNEIIRATGFMAVIKALALFTSPMAVTFDPVTRALTTEYQDMLAMNGGDQRLTDDMFIEANGGIDALALIGSSNSYTSGLASTKKDLNTFRKHADLMYDMYESTGGTDPSVAGMLSFGYEDGGGEYDAMTAEIFRANEFPETNIPMLQGKSMEDWLTDPDRKRGWYEWSKITAFRDYVIEQNGLGSTQSEAYRTSGLKKWVYDSEQALRAKYPAWGIHKDTVRSNFWTQTFNPLKVATDNQAWMRDAAKSGVQWSEIADWVDMADNFHYYYEQARINPEGGQPDLKSRREKFALWHFQYVNAASPEFQAFAERWLSNIPELDDVDDDFLAEAGVAQ